MNESRYFLLRLYNLDLHNLEIKGLAGQLPDPHSEFRWSSFEVQNIDLSNFQKMDIEDESIDDLADKFHSINIEEQPEFICTVCDAECKYEGYLLYHMKEKHDDKNSFICLECKKSLSSKRNLDNHIVNIHRTCKLCKPAKVFNSSLELSDHAWVHTICLVCHLNLKTSYKLS